MSGEDRWRCILELVEGHRAAGHRVLVVCSALAGVTNALERLLAVAGRGEDVAEALQAVWAPHEKLAREMGIDAKRVLGDTMGRLRRLSTELSARGQVAPARHADIMAHGELMSTRLGTAWLSQRGLAVDWQDVRRMLRSRPAPEGSSAEQHYLSATCDAQPDPGLRLRLAACRPVVVTQGFIASDAQGATVLLGRGGSDTSAAYLAAKLSASRLEIWTDVPGMFTANPSAVPNARLVPALSYIEAQSLAGLGARVLHPRCLRAVQEQRIPLRLAATMQPDEPGTAIDASAPRAGIKAIVSRNNLCLLSMRRPPEWQPVGFMADVAGCFARHGLSMDLLSSSPGEIRATIDVSAFPGVMSQIDTLLDDLRRVSEVEVSTGLASVSLVGHRMVEDCERFSAAARVLQWEAARLVSHAADGSSLTYVIRRDAVPGTVRRLHRELFERAGSAASGLGPTLAQLSSREPRPFLRPAPVVA